MLSIALGANVLLPIGKRRLCERVMIPEVKADFLSVEGAE